MTQDNIIDNDDGLSVEEYQQWTPHTMVVSWVAREPYLLVGLAAEAGEIAGHYAKYKRGDFDQEELLRRLRPEVGDMMYFLSEICNLYDWDLRKIMHENRIKLLNRLSRNQIRGDGDDR